MTVVERDPEHSASERLDHLALELDLLFLLGDSSLLPGRCSTLVPDRSLAPTPDSRRLARDGRDGGRLGALLALAGLELDPGALVEGLVPLAGDLRMMDEQILPTLVGRDEPVSLRSVEPLNGTGSHMNPSLPNSRTGKEGAGLRRRYSF